jgi:hypothetical protein
MKKTLSMVTVFCFIFLIPGTSLFAQHDPCGDGICQSGEDWQNCPEDCDPPNTCGNGICESYESPTNCPEDCLELYCGDAICTALIGETCETCSQDCGFCPDNYQPPETEENPIVDTPAITSEPNVRDENRDDQIRDLENSPPYPEFIPSKR